MNALPASHLSGLPTCPSVRRLLVGFASESGNARALAQRLGADPDLQPHAPQVLAFDQIDVASLGHGDVLLAISSSFGDGEPPANGERFFDSLRQTSALPGLRYAVFGLGDTGYPNFCGFTKALDTALSERNAIPLLHRVDADLGYEQFFQQWRPVLGQVLQGNVAAGQDLRLQVTAYGEANAFAAPLLDTLHVVPKTIHPCCRRWPPGTAILRPSLPCTTASCACPARACCVNWPASAAARC